MIDLSKVLSYSKDCLQSRALMRSVILDLYPNDTREMNVLLDIYESGIPKEIRGNGMISDSQYAAYVQKIENNYGLKEQYIMKGLDAWIDQCLGTGASQSIHKPLVKDTCDKAHAAANEAIVHAPIPDHSVRNVSGSPSDFDVAQDGNTVVITKFRGFDEKELVVPSEIQGKRVVGIGKEAYKDCITVERLTIAEGIEFIENSAFEGNTNLKEVILPSSLKRIGTIKEKNSKYSYLGRSLIGEASKGAFARTAIKKIALPAGLTYLGVATFEECVNLEYIDLPNEIKDINEWTFSGCKSLKTIQFPDKLENIKEYAFSGCGLTEIRLPANTRVIYDSAFSYCESLASVQLNEGLNAICRAAFTNCRSLHQIVIPSTVKSIGDGVFDITGWYQPSDRRRKGFSTKSINKTLKIYCYAGTKGIEYARKEGYPIENAAKLS